VEKKPAEEIADAPHSSRLRYDRNEIEPDRDLIWADTAKGTIVAAVRIEKRAQNLAAVFPKRSSLPQHCVELKAKGNESTDVERNGGRSKAIKLGSRLKLLQRQCS
jgi:hypothetical protein